MSEHNCSASRPAFTGAAASGNELPAPSQLQPGIVAAGDSPLASVAATFRQLTREPGPLHVDGRRLGHGLPKRKINLRELSVILVHPSTSFETRDAVWRHLIVRARGGNPAWIIGAAGVAMPALKRMAARLAAHFGDDTADLDAELLSGFVTAVREIDIDAPRVITRLCSPAFAAARRARRADLAARSGVPVRYAPAPPPQPYGHPDLVLARAVKAGIITALQADVIGATRVGEMSLEEFAAQTRRSYEAVKRCRSRGEQKLVKAIRGGRLRHRHDDDYDVILEATMTLRMPYAE